MKTKSLVFAMVALSWAAGTTAQPNKRLSAQNYLKAYYDYKELDKLPRAKEAIDEATAHEETKGDAKTWVFRGKIYQAIFEQKLKEETEKQTNVMDAARKTLAAYQAVATEELYTAVEAYTKVKELDPKKNFLPEALTKMNECMTHLINKGIANYNVRAFSAALPFYQKSIEVGNFIGVTDTTCYTSAAFVAEKSENYTVAKAMYQKLIDMKYGKGTTYASLAGVYMAAKDSLGAFDIVKKGRAAFPDDLNLLITETNFYLKANKNVEAENNLKLAVEKSPKDANLQLVLGNIYDNLANPKDDKGKETAKPADYEALIGKAETHYKKAIELKPNYFDAMYNLGVLYNNHGVAISKAADKITDQAKYAKENAMANEEYKKALPHLEKCLELEPKDKSTMYALKQLYARTQQTEKLQKINEMLKN